jgi:hypothetical protein
MHANHACQTMPAKPCLPNHACQTMPAKPCLPNHACQTMPVKPCLPDHASQPTTIKLCLPYQLKNKEKNPNGQTITHHKILLVTKQFFNLNTSYTIN